MDAEEPTDNDVVNPEPSSGDSAMPERRPSKVAIVIAMAAVAVAILIVMLAPGAADNGGAPPAGRPKATSQARRIRPRTMRRPTRRSLARLRRSTSR